MKKSKQALIKSISMFLVVLLFIGNFVIIAPENGLFMKAFAGSAENKDSFIAPIEEPDASAVKISTPEQLNAIRSDMYGSYVLTNDIDMSSYGDWTPIGKTLSDPFYGKFDGQGFKITGLKVTSNFNSGTLLAPYYAVGLFGVCKGAQIKNLVLEDVDVSINTTSGYYYESAIDSEHSVFAGAFIGYATGDTVLYNCHCSGSVAADASGEGYSDTIAGGLIGYAASSIISYSYNNAAEVTAYNGNSVQAQDAYAGGLVGRISADGVIDCCYNSGGVCSQTLDYGKAYSGGLVGNSSTSSVAITNSFNEGVIMAVSGNLFCDDAYSGGIAGNFSGSINNTYNSGEVYSKSKDSYGISDGKSYAGGIAAKSTSASQIKNSAIVQSVVSATASGSKYQYRISYQGTKSNNITINQATTGYTNDADIIHALENLKLSAPYINDLGWDFDKVWEMVEGKDFPQLKQIIVESEDYINDYIDQHLEYIDSAEYAKLLNDYRWAQIYWSQENNFKSNAAGALYKTLDAAVDIVNLRFADLFEDGNPYKILVADYVADQVVQEEVVKLYESNVSPEFKKIYNAAKAFIEKYWDDGWGELSDEDLFWLFHYNERDGEYWINSNFEEHLGEIVSNERASEEFWQAIFSVPFDHIDSILEKISAKEKKAEALFEFMTYAAHVNAYVAADEEFKMVLDLMCENLPENSEENVTHKAMLYTSLKSYTQYNDSENVTVQMYANYIAGVKLEEFKDYIFKQINDKVDSWMKANFSSAALAKIKAIGWAADTTWKIVDYITKNGELQDCREMLRANAYFESAVYNTLKSLESEFKTSPTIDNAYLFDAAFRLFKEAQIYSMDTCITYMDTYQNAWLPAIRNLSNTFMNSAIEEVHINKLFIYYSYCHGIKYNLGGKVITVACPTDVTVYDESGNIVACIENNKVTQCENGILAFTTDAVKIITVPVDQEYSVRITGTDSGYMDYSVSEFDAQMNNVQTTLYSEVSVENDVSYEGTVNNIINTDPDTYNLTNGTDIISDYTVVTEENNIPVTGLEITPEINEIYIGAEGSLAATLAPADATVKTVVWRSSDEDVIVIDEDGNYIAVAEGTATITASSIYGGASDEIEITVVSANENAEFLKDLYALVDPLSEEITNNEQHDNIIAMLNMYDSLTDYQKSFIDAEHGAKIDSIRTNFEAYNSAIVSTFVNNVDELYADYSTDDIDEINSLNDRYEDMHEVQKDAVPEETVEKLNALVQFANEQSPLLSFYALLDPLSETVTSDDQIDDILAMFDAYNELTGTQQSNIDDERAEKINTIYDNLNTYNQEKADAYSDKVDALYESHTADDIDAIVDLVNEYNALHGTQKALVSDETMAKLDELIAFAEAQNELVPFYAILDPLPEKVETQAQAKAAQEMLDAYNALTDEQKANIDSERKAKIENIKKNLDDFNKIGTTIIKSGKCGDNLTWTLYDEGTLIIEGTGESWDWSSNFKAVPWYSLKENIKQVLIGDKVTYIEKNAWRGCENLSEFIVSDNNDSFSTIDGVLFNKDKSVLIRCPLSKVGEYTVPASVTKIYRLAFYECASLTRIDIHQNVNYIDTFVFSYCDDLKEIVVDENNQFYRSIDGVLFDYDVKTLMSYPCGKEIVDGVYTIPAGVENIASDAFVIASNLSHIDIPNSVIYIGTHAFKYCTLEHITIANNVQTIDDCAFAYCENLKSITLPKSIETIAKSVFSGSSSLDTVYYAGSESDWNSVSIGSDNKWLTNATIYFNAPSITLDKTDATLMADDVLLLQATIIADKATTDSLVWSSSDESIATVDENGTVTAIALGSCTITATAGEVSATCSVTVIEPLAKPTNLYAYTFGYTSIRMTWDAVEGADGYEIFRCDRAGQPYNYVDTVSADAGETAYRNIGLSTGTTYYYKVRAYKTLEDGTKLYSEFSAYSSARPLPATPVVTAVRTSATTAKISWVKIYGATGYSVYRSTEENGEYTFVANLKSGDTTTYKATGLASSKTYYYKVRAYRQMGDDMMFGSYSKPAAAFGAPAVPTITARSVGYTSAKVLWEPVAGADGYAIYRCDVGGGAYSYITSVGADVTTYTNTGLSTGTTYYYKVRAFVNTDSGKLYSNYSPCATARPIPATPVVTVTADDANNATISWVRIYGATGYSVYRSAEKDGTYSFLAGISSGDTVSYTDKNTDEGVTYYYKVRAYRQMGKDMMFGEYSKPVEGITK